MLIDRERDALRDELNATLGRVMAHGAPLDVDRAHQRRTRIFKAVAHALLYTAQDAGISHCELFAVLQGRPAEKPGRAIAHVWPTRAMARLGLERLEEQERVRINVLLRMLYSAIGDTRAIVVVDLFGRFVLENAAVIGLARAVALQRLENLDLLQRASGLPRAFIPVEQYGL
jgi:hypothetical protein